MKPIEEICPLNSVSNSFRFLIHNIFVILSATPRKKLNALRKSEFSSHNSKRLYDFMFFSMSLNGAEMNKMTCIKWKLHLAVLVWIVLITNNVFTFILDFFS